MSNVVFGYARVSTEDQSLNMQIDAFKKYGCDCVVEEKMSGAKKDRPKLQQMLSELKSGDKVVVYKLDRISRSTKHLIELVELFEAKGVEFVSISDQIDTSTAMGRFFFRTMASIAELERDIISDRTKAGLEAARARGRFGGRPAADNGDIEQALTLYDSKKYTVPQITEMTGVGKTTLYKYLKKRQAKETM
jgi:DNA invertase Pin-like site-specific DNA recombinase